MIKKILKYLVLLLAAMICFVIVFFFWGSMPTIDTDQYAATYTYEDNTILHNDSIFSIITYNIGYLSGMTNNLAIDREKQLFDKNLQQVIQAFNKYQPDFIALQEVDFSAVRSYEVNQAAALSKALGLRQNAISVNWDKRYVPFPYFPLSNHFGKIVSGQAVLSRFTIEENQRIVLEKVADNPFYYNRFYLDRLAQICRLKIAKNTLIIINVHLEAFDKATRRKQSEYVWELYKQYEQQYPVILLGDFNSMPPTEEQPDPTIGVFLGHNNIISVFPPKTFHQPSSATYPSAKPTEQIDYIFYNPKKITPLSWKRVDQAGEASDHLPIMMSFKLNN